MLAFDRETLLADQLRDAQDAVAEQANDGNIDAARALLGARVLPLQDAFNDTASTNEDTAVVLNASSLLANDSDPNGNPLSITAVGSASSGSVVFDATAASDAGIDVVSSEYATIAAEQTALENLSRDIADRIVSALAQHIQASS